MKIGFTGTREGMSQQQKEEFALLINQLGATEFHHGDCAGADEDAHSIVREIFPGVRIIVHPPSSSYLQAYCRGDEHRAPATYLVRDRAIVESTEYLIGAPLSDTPAPKSGTWYTIRYAQKLGRPHTILAR